MTPARCRKVKEVGQGFAPKLATEAPVNGGRNYDGPKVSQIASLSKTEPYAGKSSHSRMVLTGFVRTVKIHSDMGPIRREDSLHRKREPSET
jgi:hypothetical protein